MNDLREHLDAGIGAGPAHRDLAPVLAAGRRAVRRRRLAAGAGALAVVAVVGTTVAVASGRPDAARDLHPATQGPTSAAPTNDPSPAATPTPETPWEAKSFIRYTDGTLEVRPGVDVLDRVDDYLAGVRKYTRSVAMDIVFKGTESWVTAEQMRDGSSGYSWSEPSDGWADFRAWVADQSAANGADAAVGGTGYPDLVTVAGDGRFVPVGSAEIIRQSTADLPDGFDRAAYVELDGNRYLVLARTIDGQPDVITIHAEPHGGSLEELLAYARDKYASGEGVR